MKEVINVLCKYCEEDEGEYIINTRTELSGKRDFYPGIQINIYEGNLLSVTAISDVYEPNCTEAEARINYCPMCGRKLK